MDSICENGFVRVSNRYGKFAIARDDLQQMLCNFRRGHAASPDRVARSTGSFSMDPKHPGDGIAVGWLEGLELRAEGEELWGRVSWTERRAGGIRDQPLSVRVAILFERPHA